MSLGPAPGKGLSTISQHGRGIHIKSRCVSFDLCSSKVTNAILKPHSHVFTCP